MRPNGKNIHRRQDAKESDVWGVSPDEGFSEKLSTEDEKKWMQWRRDRDVVRPHSERDANAEERGKAALKNDAALRRAVEYLESHVKDDSKPSAAG
jgi:hypothetical protein